MLMDGSADRAEHMTDWTLAGTLGDLGTPLLLWLLDAGGFSWRWTFAVVGLAVAAFAALVLNLDGISPGRAKASNHDAPSDDDAPNDADPAADDDDAEPSLREALRLIRGNRPLLWWLLAAALCSLLDELFASQLGIHLAHNLGRNESTEAVTLQLIVLGLGGAVGLVVQRALLRRYAGPTILMYTCAGTLLFYGVWLFALPGAFSIVWAALLGAFIATHYPLAQARAYDALPGRANVVAAASQAFSGIDLLYPVMVGALSDHFSPLFGLCALLVQPLGILVALVATRRKPE
jgi:Na+/melibiose symporter-like transporter